MNDRIQLILKTKNISASKFADEINVQRSSISHILSGRNNPSLDFIQKILKRFPDINSDWILTGKGSMYTEPDLFTTLEEVKPERKNKSNDLSNSEDDDNSIENDIITNEINPMQRSFKGNSIKVKNIVRPDEHQLTKDPDMKKTTDFGIKTRKKIEKIIFFYSDRTCSEYSPE